MKGFFLGLGVAAAGIINVCVGAEYFAPVRTLRAARATVRHLFPIPIHARLKFSELQEIKDLDDVWCVSHRLADIYNLYKYDHIHKQWMFAEAEAKKYMTGRATSELYRMLERARPDMSIYELERLLFSDHCCHESIETLAFCWKIDVRPEEPWDEALRLAGLLWAMPTDPSKNKNFSTIEDKRVK